MNELLAALVGFIAAAAIAFFLNRAGKRQLSEHAARLTEQVAEKELKLQESQSELRNVLEAKGRAEQESSRVPKLESSISELQKTNTLLQTQVAAILTQEETNVEKLRWIEQAEQQLRETFQALAGQALRANSNQFLETAKQQTQGLLTEVRGDWNTQKVEMEKLVQPLEKTLDSMSSQVRELEEKRQNAYGELRSQLQQLATTQQDLQISTVNLTHALKASGPKGKWGELQLRRIVELAGMTKHVDFDEQASTDEGRPDMTIHLPNQGILPLDSKVPMDAYLDSLSSSDENVRIAKIDQHAKVMRGRVLNLAQKKYWQQFPRTPDFVIMFVPNESCLGAAFEYDPDLLEYAIKQGVLPASPVTLLALLKSVAYGWQQHQAAENARQIAEECRELLKRVKILLEHMNSLRTNIGQTVNDFNDMMGSFQSRFLPSLRRISEMANVDAVLPDQKSIEQTPRVVEANRFDAPLLDGMEKNAQEGQPLLQEPEEGTLRQK